MLAAQKRQTNTEARGSPLPNMAPKIQASHPATLGLSPVPCLTSKAHLAARIT